MPAAQYPFIDIAVHPRIRERFARGEAMALFSAGLDRVLWANGAGADLFGHPAIYDFIDQGPKQGDVSFRQVASTAHQLTAVGDTRSFLIRIAAGFQRVVVNATVEMVRIQAGEEAVLFSCPVSSKALDTAESARGMLEGFDDPDTHMAVIGRDGEIIASSTGFKALGITPQTASMLVTMAGVQPERMIKRPIPTGQGYLPAAIGRLSDSPALHLLFVVEMVIGHLDPVETGVSSPTVAPVVQATVATTESAEATANGVVAAKAPAIETGGAETTGTEGESQALVLHPEERQTVIPTEVADEATAASHADISTAAATEEIFSEPAPIETAAPFAQEPEDETPTAHAPEQTDPSLKIADDIEAERPTTELTADIAAVPSTAETDVGPVSIVESDASDDAPAGTLGAIPAASLPTEAVATEVTSEEAELRHEPEAAGGSLEKGVADMLAAIPADHLPAEAATLDAPAMDLQTGHTDAHDLHDEAAGLIGMPESASVLDQESEWATSDLPLVPGDVSPGYMETVVNDDPQTATFLREEAASEMPAVQAADIAHQFDIDDLISGKLVPTDILPEPVHEVHLGADAGVTSEAAGAPVIEPEDHPSEDIIQPAGAASIAEAAPQENPAFAAMIDAVAEIEDVDDSLEEITEDAPQASGENDDAGDKGEESPVAHDAHPMEDSETQPAHILDALPTDEPDVSVVEDNIEDAAHGFVSVNASDEAVLARNKEEHFEPSAPSAEHTSDEPAQAGALDLVRAEEVTGPSTDDVMADHEAHHSVPAAVEHDDAATEAEAESAALQEAANLSGEPPVAQTPDRPIAAEEAEKPAAAEIDAEPAPDVVASPSDQSTGFVFNRSGRATRFVWKIDAAGRFSEISREFAEAVGPHATSVTGVAFADIAALFNLDPDGKIAELLARRDTWSGRTIHWPVEGTTLTVPVDLAALPTYTRSREFDGFRGFGVVRLSDAAEDPMKIGLTLGQDATATDAAKTSTSETDVAVAKAPLENAPETAPASEDVELAATHEIADSTESEAPLHAGEPLAPEADEPELPFNGEPPALRIAETPGRRLSDKIIQLHEHRLSISDSLSPSEQAAFREIAKQLEPFGKRGEPPVEQIEETADSKLETDETADGFDEASVPHVAANDDIKGVQDLPPAEDAEKVEEGFDPLAALNTAIPPRSKMTDGLSAEIVDQLPVAVLVHAGDTLIHANPEFLRLTGYKDLADIEGVGGLDALLQRHDLQGKTERPGTMVLVRADDALVPVTARLQSIRWEDSSALMLALMPVEKDSEAADAAPRTDPRDEARPERMLEKVAKLQVEVEELQSILETATDGVAIIGPEGDIRSMNRSASALFNYDEQETRGKPFVMLFAHESQKAVLDYLAGLTGNGVASVLNDGREVIGREASGGFVPLFMTMGVLTSSNGYCAVIRDITQWKRTEEELRNAKRAAETANAHKSDFLARVSHEIRTPLNAIIGFSDMMASERLGPIGHARYVEYAGDIGRSGRHVLDIVNDLLDISKIEAGEMELEFGSVGLNAAIAEAVSIVQPQANGQRVIIRTALAQSVPNVVADLRSIKQIALNILSNAIRFTPSGGQIVVSTSYEGNGSVVLRIRDTGVGMTRTELEQAMKPFRQVATNSRQRGDGTGLGLPLTKAMVDANRALFAIHSAPNEGTLVEVTFPSQRVLAN